MLRGIFFLLCWLTVQPARAQTATATLDSTRILVGSVATLRLEASAPKGAALQWPTLPDSIGGLEVLSRGEVDTLVRADGVAYQQSVQITGFDSGLFTVPAISFPTENGTLQTLPVPLLVQTLPVDTTQPFRPIKDIIEVPVSWLDYWPYLLTGLLLLAVLLFVLLRKKKPKVSKPRTMESASIAALRALAELEKSGLAERGAMGEFFTRSSNILRRYLETQFRIVALEEPTDAMLRSIRERNDLKSQYGVLREFFLTADLAKFAKATPTPGEAQDALGQARAFIQASANKAKTPAG